jgi:hypothetical protein
MYDSGVATCFLENHSAAWDWEGWTDLEACLAFWFWDGVYNNLELEGVVLCSNSGMGGVKHGTLLNSVV